MVNYIGKKIYYDKETGNVLVDTGDKFGSVIEQSIEQDINNYKVLSELKMETFDVIHLEYGQYSEDFAECNGYRINPSTKEIEFSYPDPNNEEPEAPVYQKSLSEEIEELRQIIDILIGGEDNE